MNNPQDRDALLERALGDELVMRLDELRQLIRSELPEASAERLMHAIEEVLVAVLSRVTSMAANTVVATLKGGRRKPRP